MYSRVGNQVRLNSQRVGMREEGSEVKEAVQLPGELEGYVVEMACLSSS